MAAPDLLIRLGIDPGDLQKGIQTSVKEIDKLEDEIVDLTRQFQVGGLKVDEYGKSLNKLEGRIQAHQRANIKASAALGGFSKKMSANAVPAMQEFSRVIQDAPYGVQGVANNVQQLTSQFQYLSAKSGGAVNALKLMAGSLAGPAGILLAVSALTVALPSLIKEFQGGATAAERFAEAVKSLKTALSVVKGQVSLIRKQIELRELQGKSTIGLLKAEMSLLKTQRSQLKTVRDATLKQLDSAESTRIMANNWQVAWQYAKAIATGQWTKIQLIDTDQVNKINELGEAVWAADEAVVQADIDIEKLKIEIENYGKAADGAKTKTDALTGSFARMGMFIQAIPLMQTGIDTVTKGLKDGSAEIETGTEDLVNTGTTAAQRVIDMGNLMANAFSNFGSGIGDAIASGSLSVKGAGKLLMAAFGDLLVGLGKAMIAYGFALVAFENAFSNPIAAIAAGTAAVVAGKIITSMAKSAYSDVTGAASSGVSGSGSSGGFSGSPV
jgi:archaellum component FlaC